MILTLLAISVRQQKNLIKCSFFTGEYTFQTQHWLEKSHNNCPLSKTTISWRFADFKRGRPGIDNAQRNGSSEEVITPENLKMIKK